MFGYLRKIAPFAIKTAGMVAVALTIISVGRWLVGSFEPFASAEDFWRRLAFGVVIVLAIGLICGIIADLENRYDDWRQRKTRR